MRVPGHGDKSIQTFGTPAPSSQFPAIAAAVRSYALSVATDNAAAACRLLARGVIQQLVQGYGATAHSSCPRLLAGLFDRYPTAYRRQLAHLRVTDARTQASRGYAFYTIPGAPPGFIPVSQEDAAWHLLAIAGSNLP